MRFNNFSKKNFPLAIFSTFTFLITVSVYAKLSPQNKINVSGADLLAIVWAGQGKHSQDIAYRSYRNDKWGKPLFITENQLNSATPTIAGDAENNIWVMWSEANSKAAELRYRIKYANTGAWGEPKTFETGFGHNSTPALVKDKNGKLWCFWVAVDGEDDEIFYSYWGAGQWQKPTRMAADNKVPDLEPKVTLTAKGYPEVSWQSFDMKTFKYRYKRALWNGEQWEQLGFQIANPLTNQARKIDVKLPNDLPRRYSILNQH